MTHKLALFLTLTIFNRISFLVAMVLYQVLFNEGGFIHILYILNIK